GATRPRTDGLCGRANARNQGAVCRRDPAISRRRRNGLCQARRTERLSRAHARSRECRRPGTNTRAATADQSLDAGAQGGGEGDRGKARSRRARTRRAVSLQERGAWSAREGGERRGAAAGELSPVSPRDAPPHARIADRGTAREV